MRGVIGIRKETKDPTERRAPLSPEHVKHLQQQGIQVVVEPSENRIFTEEEYRQAGATISDDLSQCNIIFGVKEVPIRDLIANKTFCFFSHTIKGQPFNMPMLQAILDLNITLLDYELVKDEHGKRIIYFSNFAGYAGMIDTLWALGRRLEWEGIHTPFSAIRQAYQYESLDAAKRAIQDVGQTIAKEGLPEALTPLVFAFTGRGHVSVAAQEIFDLLPHETIDPEVIPDLVESGKADSKKVYKAIFLKEHLYKPRNPGEAFSREKLAAHPEAFESRFPEFLPYITVLVNGIYWEPRYPRMVTREDLHRLFAGETQPRLRVIGDITCDIEGSIEVTVKPTTYKNPVYVYDVTRQEIVDGWAGRGPVILAVDKLPTELPREATEWFGQSLLPFVPELAMMDFTRPLEAVQQSLPAPFRHAVIAHQGRLTPEFEYLYEELSKNAGNK